MWRPPDQISKKETIGRRAFGKDTSIFSDKDGSKYRIDIFFDDRIDTDLSFDRLGVRRADQKVITFLTPLGDAIGKKMEKEFRGWAQVKVEQLRHLMVNKTAAEGEDNPYHAELCRGDFRNVNAARVLAFKLSVLASQQDFVWAMRD